MSLYVGVDAGGTSTNVVAEGDGVSGTFEGEGANVRRTGVDGAASVIARAVSAACEGRRADRVAVGAAGAGHPEIAAALTRALSERLPGSAILVTDDARIALRAATDGDGIVVIAGTGSIAYASIGDRTFHAGGHGFLLGDEGSGAAIGSAAVRLLLRAYEGRAPRDGFIEAIESLFDAEDAQDVKQAIYREPDPVAKLASVAPVVLACASAGERSATKIVQAAALELFDLLKSVVRQAQFGDRDLPVVLAGGLLSANSLLTYLLETRISNEFPHLA
ncbi:MAG TPA: BadF/BadG/BcrA/BcrD ATPase family protein, partial [Candidatus Aquilonibacter sp.]|nr:BadF/BadG/BcrA/BcrD ATPase family protein [Candidatus Aquilonibacter sp.]